MRHVKTRSWGMASILLAGLAIVGLSALTNTRSAHNPSAAEPNREEPPMLKQVNPSAERNQQAATADPNWWRYCRIMLEWTHPKRDLNPEQWVPEVVERSQKLGVNALAYDFWHGGYAVFNGAVVPKDDHVGSSDVLALLDRELHQRGMYLVAMNMGAHCSNYAAEEYPGWRAVDPQGQPMPFAQGNLMCLNSPYGNLLLQELTEMLPRYRIDGLYVEGLYALSCYCDYCCKEFERTYGYPIPRDAQAGANKDLARFRTDTITHFVRRLRRVIDEVSPKTVLMPCPSSWEGVMADFAAWAPYSNAITVERQWGFDRNMGVKLFEIGMSMQSVRAESKRPPMGTTWIAWQVDCNYAPCTPQHYRSNFFEIFMNGATPQLHAQTIFETDASESETVHEMYSLEERCRPYLLDAEFVPYAALVVDWWNYSASESAKGYYQALMEKHVPFQVISKRDLKMPDLSRYKVLLLPNVERISNEQIEAINAYQAQGGGVVLTYKTGWLDESNGARRSDPAFMKMAGINGPYRVVTNPVGAAYTSQLLNYYKITQDHPIGAGTLGRLQSFTGSYVEVETTTGEAIASVLDYDYSKMHRNHPVMGRYPGHPISPLIVVNKNSGQGSQGGRVAYFAGEFDAKCYNTGLPGTIDTLTEAADWAANATPPVQVEAGPTVRVTTQFSPARNAYTVMLLNQTTNDIDPGKVIRYIQPLRDVKITLNGLEKNVSTVTSLTGGSFKHVVAGQTCTITLNELKDYEVVVVELAH